MIHPDAPERIREARRAARRARLERAWPPALIGTMVVFSALPLANMLLGLSTKDYDLWYQVGLALRQGLDIYPRPETGRLFPFMYPPSAAAMLGAVSLLGRTGCLIALVAITSIAWLASIALSIWLTVAPGERRHPLLAIVPTLSVIVLIHNTYLLGQPNLMLLALVLGAFACLRLKREFSAGALVATAAAIKAFPALVLGYLVYRRMWRAAASTVIVLAAWLLVAPLPFRTPAQVVDDLSVWSRGMLFTYDTHGIAQRPLRSYSYKNQSIMAVMHRLLRDVPADGESVLSRRARAEHPGPRPKKGLPPVSPSDDLISFLKPHHHSARASSAAAGPAAPRRWKAAIKGAAPALKAAWHVNIAHLSFRAVSVLIVAAGAGLSWFFIAMMPRRDRRTRQSDAIEYALVVLFTVIFSPLSFNYAYVWMLYPTTVALHRVLSAPADAPHRRLRLAWLAAILFIPALAAPMPKLAQACGNLFVPALLLVFGLGLMLRGAGQGPDTGQEADDQPGATHNLAPAPHARDRRAFVSSETPSPC